MLDRLFLSLLLSSALLQGSSRVRVRTMDGSEMEAQTDLRSVRIEVAGKTSDYRLADILSIHNGAEASEFEGGRIALDLAAIQAADRKARDRAVEELTSIGLPVVTPLLKALKDTDQHEPRPLYRLFERVMPSQADGFDRTLTLIRLKNGEAVRGKLPEGTVEVRAANQPATSLPWSKIRSLAVQQRLVRRSAPVHSLKHSTRIEYLDTGIVLTTTSKVDSTARGFVRLSWNDDGWASDADGLKKPGSPSYKTNLVDGQPFGALLGRAGADGDVFVLGKKATKTGLPAGRLNLAVNDNAHWQNNVGSYSVSLTATDAYDVGDAQ
ncbi:MAG TPA: hypothetical protein VMZ52_15815 [Bryobacteraceae bacterium]|nr:hypothetical protein [Bryobacteraceae bacterium]